MYPGIVRLAKRTPTIGRPFRPRRAMTLVELLIVVAISVIVMASAIPALRSTVKENKIREASRQLNVFLMYARSQAVERNRPVGVWLERSQLSPNASTQLFLAETPQLYSGDILGATTVGFFNLNGDTHFETVACSPGTASMLLSVVQPEDLIRFGFQGPWFRVRSKPAVATVAMVPVIHFWFCHPEQRFTVGSDGAWGIAGSDDDGNGVVDDLSEAGWPGKPGMPGAPPSDDIWLQPVPPIMSGGSATQTFQILRFPRKKIAGSLELPAGTIVDLRFSGIGVDGVDFETMGTGVGLDNQWGVAGFDDDASGIVDEASEAGWPSSDDIKDRTPVIVMFSPNGNIDRIVYHGTTRAPSGNVHFLIGRVEGIEATTSPNSIARGNGPNPNNLITIDQNVADPTTVWVSVGTKNGTSSATENLWVLTPDPNMGNQITLRASMVQARQRASRAQTVGGI